MIILPQKIKTMYKNGTSPCSQQQLHIHLLVGGELNYPFGKLSLDIAFPDKMIYIEYDGGGHDLNVKLGQITQEDFIRNQIKRDTFLKSKGWKLIRIKSIKDILPDDETLKSLISDSFEYLLNSKRSWTQIDLDD